MPFPKKKTTFGLPKIAEIYFDFRKHHYDCRHSFDHYIASCGRHGRDAERATIKSFGREKLPVVVAWILEITLQFARPFQWNLGCIIPA